MAIDDRVCFPSEDLLTVVPAVRRRAGRTAKVTEDFRWLMNALHTMCPVLGLTYGYVSPDGTYIRLTAEDPSTHVQVGDFVGIFPLGPIGSSTDVNARGDGFPSTYLEVTRPLYDEHPGLGETLRAAEITPWTTNWGKRRARGFDDVSDGDIYELRFDYQTAITPVDRGTCGRCFQPISPAGTCGCP